jgi:IclR family transcriptional regulator, KDG regulon repressor
MVRKRIKQNQSLGKAFRIIEAMSEAGGPQRLQDIAARVGQPASTVLRFLGTLAGLGYVGQDERSLHYFLTMKFARLGHQVGRQLDFREVVRPFLLELSREFKESSSLAVEQDMNVVYVDAVDGPDHMLQTLQRIGKIAPLHATGVGKVLLAEFPAGRLEELLRERGLPAITRNTIRSKKALLIELEKIRRQGFALDDEECESGVRCVAAGIRDHSGNIIAACSASGPAGRMTAQKLELIRIRLSAAAAEISTRLGYQAG